MLFSVHIEAITEEKNEDGVISVYAHIYVDNKPFRKVMVFPTLTYPAGTVSPWEIHKAAQLLRRSFGLPEE